MYIYEYRHMANTIFIKVCPTLVLPVYSTIQ